LIDRLELILFSRQQQPYPQGDERERIARARQAAEALFASKPAVDEPSVVEDPAPSDQQPRKPRVLSIVPPAPVRAEHPEPQARRTRRPSRGIPRSQYARIRTWVEYGMTAAEVAEVYGTAVGEIERILGTA
jgi:hypothetical protein